MDDDATFSLMLAETTIRKAAVVLEMAGVPPEEIATALAIVMRDAMVVAGPSWDWPRQLGKIVDGFNETGFHPKGMN